MAKEENLLEQYLVYMAKCGFLLTRTMVKAFAWAIAKHVGKDDRFTKDYGPTDHWWQLFMHQHPIPTFCKADNLECSHAEAFNPDTVNEYFEMLDTVLTSNNLKKSPRRSYL